MALLFFLIVFSQFGGRIRAASATSWWLVALFLLIGVIDPKLYQPIADVLGVKLVSNLVLAAVTLFLMYQLLELSAITTSDRRRIRTALSALAADAFIDRRRAAAVTSRPDVFVIVPCYNEEKALPRMISRLSDLKACAPFSLDYCLIDDASTDRSAALLARLAPFNYARHMANLGVSGGLMTGFAMGEALGAQYMVQCDGDGQHPVEEIPRLLQIAREQGGDLVVGSRFVSDDRRQANHESTTQLRRYGSLLLVWTLRVLWPTARSTDPTSGFRVYSARATKLLLQVMPDEYPEPETIALAQTARLKMCEVPVVMEPRTTGQSSLSGIKSLFFMVKVITALVGLRLRSIWLRRAE